MRSKLFTLACAVYIMYAIVLAQGTTVQLLHSDETQNVCNMHILADATEVAIKEHLQKN